ncbi:MAG: single-stranded DNA-binding protein [Deltaproteobacteria bacterium]|nr:single-stranded DNA-binding protein [Deltaproteobacteria bacterium]
MSDLNKVMIIGRLGGQPECKTLPSGASVCKLNVATSSHRQNEGKWEKETMWHTVVAFDRLAERCGEFLTTGRLVYVEGKLHAREWVGKDGTKHLDREIRATDVHFLASPGPRGPQPPREVAAVAV